MAESPAPERDTHAAPPAPAHAGVTPAQAGVIPAAAGVLPAQAGGTPAQSAAPAARQPLADSAEPTVSPDQVKAALRKVKDPDLNLNIVDLGLIYGISVEGSKVNVDMSLTSPGCPSGPEIMGDAEQQLRALPGVSDVAMNLVWSPPWTPDRIEPRVRAYLGF